MIVNDESFTYGPIQTEFMVQNGDRWISPFKKNLKEIYQGRTSIQVKSVKSTGEVVKVVLFYKEGINSILDSIDKYQKSLYWFARQARSHKVDRRIEITVLDADKQEIDSLYLEPRWCNERYLKEKGTVLDRDPEVNSVHQRLLKTSCLVTGQ